MMRRWPIDGQAGVRWLEKWIAEGLWSASILQKPRFKKTSGSLSLDAFQATR
jgi:hypothetical protein